MARAYYNEIDPYAAQWLRNLIAAGHIAPGDVDERSIVDVRPDDIAGYTQCHFFAGIGGWSYAARLAGWPDERPLWTGSCPCQPFSVAGKQEGQADERHLWPVFFNLIRAARPAVVMGEQVAAAVGKHWLDGVHSDLEAIGYSVGAAVVPACAVDAPHRRDRLWFVADTSSERRNRIDALLRQDTSGRLTPDIPEAAGSSSRAVADTHGISGGQGHQDAGRGSRGSAARSVAGPSGTRDGALADTDLPGASQEREQRGGQLGRAGSNSRGSAWVGAEWLAGADGKARRVEPGIRLLAHGVPARVGKLRAYGNAIVPQVAAEVIGAFLDAERGAA
jgi:DNA (cytosine-5)-methyltransferase 1